MENRKKLYRSVTNKVIGGVAGGLSEYFDIDVVVVRLLFVLLLLFSGGGLLAYIVLWIVIPRQPLLSENNAAGNAEPYAQPQSDETTANNHNTSRSAIAGIILVFLGLLFLFDNMMPWYNIRMFWPLILVFAGILIIYPEILKSNSNTESHEK